MKKKLICLLLALAVCLSLTACGGKAEKGVTITNNVGYTLKEIYISTNDSSDWGDNLVPGTLADGASMTLKLSERFGGTEAVLDIRALDEDGDAYEFFELSLKDGDSVTLNWDSDEPDAKVVSGKDEKTYAGQLTMKSEDVGSIEDYLGCWKYDDYDAYIAIYEDYTWQLVDGTGNVTMNPGVMESGDSIVLLDENGEDYLGLYFNNGTLTDEEGDTLHPSPWPTGSEDEGEGESAGDGLPTPNDALNASISMPGISPSFDVWYPGDTMEGHQHPNMDCGLSFNALNEEGTDDYYSNIIVSLASISGYDQYMCKGYDTARHYMQLMSNDIINSMYGDKVLKTIGADFTDGGSYYSMMNYIWMDGSIFYDATSTPVRATVEIRYVGPTGYALVVSALSLENRIQNYYEIACRMIDNIDYGDWSTAPKSVPASGGSGGAWSDTGDYGDTYYWTDEDGDVWYWNGYEDIFIGFGDDYYVDGDQYYEANDAGWDDDYYDYYDYYDDYDPWSDPGDYYDDGYGDFF